MKQINIIEEAAPISEAAWNELFSNMEEYNKYVTHKLKAILDFDVWFEHSTNGTFPREWYSMIRKNGEDK